MDITSTTPTGPATPGSATTAQAATTQAATTLNSDFETFIKMLTVQMENQDPLNPVDSSDFATQLATFSSVEQQVLTNTLLTGLGAQIGALGVAQLSGWVGMEARAEIPVVFDGDPITLSLRTDTLADSAQLVVRNSQGTEIQRLDVPPQDGEFVWTGVDDLGNPLPAGTYDIDVESLSQGAVIATKPAEVHGLIVEASNDHGTPALVLESGQTVSADQILGLSAPAS